MPGQLVPGIGQTDVNADFLYQPKRQSIGYVRSTCGRRHEPVTSRKRGKYVRFRYPADSDGDVALDATLRAAAGRKSTTGVRTLDVQPQDLRQKVRRHRSPYHIVFVIDNSWSIHVEKTVEQTKGVVLELLKDARYHHDKVALVAFRHNRHPDAAVCLPLTKSYAFAAERLRRIPLSGSTPLSDGIFKAHTVLRQDLIKSPNALPVIVIVTDGLPTIPLHPGGDPYREITLLCRRLRWEKIATLVVDIEASGPASGRSLCQEMARCSGGRYLPLSKLTRQSIERVLARKNGTRSSGPVSEQLR